MDVPGFEADHLVCAHSPWSPAEALPRCDRAFTEDQLAVVPDPQALDGVLVLDAFCLFLLCTVVAAE